ncbi:unnamed protein product [Knipowitschia caucasica]|uniref:Uncharacterized protein n=1 Tax=Knipowitschia caucasica TaxID=637954 RepID=A0AAV2KA56_KNICA
MAPQLYVFLLVLAFLRATAEPECQNLVKPLVLDRHSPIYGKWVLHVASWDKEELKDGLFSLKATMMEVSAHADNEHLTVYWVDRMRKDDSCLQGLINSTVSGQTVRGAYNNNGHTIYREGKFYETCADCLLSEDTICGPDGTSMGRFLFLFTRSGKLEPSHLETYKKQAKCLEFPEEFFFTSDDPCPDQRETVTSATENKPAATEAPAKSGHRDVVGSHQSSDLQDYYKPRNIKKSKRQFWVKKS